MNLCMEANRRPGLIVEMRWWEHEGLDLEGIRTVAREAEQTEGEEETYGMETVTDN